MVKRMTTATMMTTMRIMIADVTARHRRNATNDVHPLTETEKEEDDTQNERHAKGEDCRDGNRLLDRDILGVIQRHDKTQKQCQ
jgi:hypothetical protein